MRKTVLLVGNFLSASGGSRAVGEDLSIELSRRGWSVLAASRKPRRVARLLDMLGSTWNLRHRYDVIQVDVFSGPSFLWAAGVCLLAREAGKPIVLTLRGGNLPQFAGRWPNRVRRLLHAAEAVTVPSGFLLEQMRPYCDGLQLMPNPLYLGRYPFTLREAVEPRLVWLRAFHEIYNPTMAVEVLAQVRAVFPETRLLMIGPDKSDGSWQRVERVALSLGVADRLTLQPGVPKAEVPRWLSQGGIFLNTTNVDNTPVSVIEAMACGLCVVSTNVGGMCYLLEHGRDALLVPRGDAAAMAAAVRAILVDPALAARLSSAARMKAERFDWSVVIPRWEALLTKTASDGSKPALQQARRLKHSTVGRP